MFYEPASINGYRMKCSGGETTYILMTCFKLWETVYYHNWTNKSHKALLQPGRFVGFAWNIGNPMTFKVLHENNNLNRRNLGLHRGDFIPWNSAAMRYNSTLAPKSDAYFSEVHLKGDPPSKPDTLEQHGKADTPNISISEGKVERHKNSNSSLIVGASQT